jgi:predicted DNA-binding protein (MmcQ/YjbR family)
MNIDLLRAYCLSLPQAAEKIQWENDLLFTIGGKIFAVTPLEPAPFVLTFKPDPEHRLELLEIEGVEPAPYLARAGWVSVRTWDVFRDSEWREHVGESYRMVVSKLPKKLQAQLSPDAGDKATTGSKGSTSKRNASARSGGRKSAGDTAKGSARKSGAQKPVTARKSAGKRSGSTPKARSRSR